VIGELLRPHPGRYGTVTKSSRNDRAEAVSSSHASAASAGKYAQVNGLKMYYEVHGAGRPLVLLHGGVSNIQKDFGPLIPRLAKTHKVIAPEQAARHPGRSP